MTAHRSSRDWQSTGNGPNGRVQTTGHFRAGYDPNAGFLPAGVGFVSRSQSRDTLTMLHVPAFAVLRALGMTVTEASTHLASLMERHQADPDTLPYLTMRINNQTGEPYLEFTIRVAESRFHDPMNPRLPRFFGSILPNQADSDF